MSPLEGIFRHTAKGGEYKVLHEATNEADLTHVVVYKSLLTDIIWVRPKSEFLEKFTKVRYRSI